MEINLLETQMNFKKIGWILIAGVAASIPLMLMKKYIEIGNEMKAQSQIIEFYISSFSDVDLSKYGAKKVCNDWVI